MNEKINLLQRGWRECKLGDVANYVNRGVSPSYVETDGMLVLNQKCIRNGKIDFTLARLTNKDKQIQPQKLLSKNDILINSTGVGTAGRVAILLAETVATADSHVTIIRVDGDKADPKYIFYSLFRSESDLEMLAEGSTGQIELGRERIREISVNLPPLPEQRAIAEVLSSLDDKIDLLHRQNKTLESMAEALWREMFVEEAEVGWKVVTVGDVVTIKGGTTPSTKNSEFWDGNICWTSPRDLSDHDSVYIFDTERKITAAGLAQIGSGLLPAGSVLLSSRAPIGYLAITDIELAINQGYIGIVCDKVIRNSYMFLWMRQNMDSIIAAANGSTFLEISKSVFKGLDFILPCPKSLDRFNKEAAAFFAKIRNNQIQARALLKLRDTLLPKLLSGEVRVNT